MLYTPGREVTVAGEVIGTCERSASRDGRSLVLLRSRELKLWPSDHPARNSPKWMDPLYDPTNPQGMYDY